MTTAKVFEQQLVQVEGQTDILTMAPYICRTTSIDHEPDPRGVPRSRVLLQPLPRQAAVARAAC